MRVSTEFFAQCTVIVARALLGQRLVRVVDGRRISGLVSETEAYGGPDDLASHARRRTPRSALMYGPPGVAYIYFVYGFHYCLNAVTEPDGQPGAVLIRAIVPEEGIDEMRAQRGRAPDPQLVNGPGKLCQALQITSSLNGSSLVDSPTLYFEHADPISAAHTVSTPRIGVRGDSQALLRSWRFVWSPGIHD